MIHELGVELGALLAARGCPLKVIDGPEPTQTVTFARERIVIEHAEADAFDAARSNHKNPKLAWVRKVGVKLTIYAQSPASGATQWEHKRRAEHVLDLVLVGLRDAAAVRKQGLELKAGRFAPPADLEGSPVQGGAVYELSFAIERGIFAQKWNGDVRPQAAVVPGMILSTDEITTTNGPIGQIPEMGC